MIIDVQGGTKPYTYSWSNHETTPNLSNLAPGTYEITVTDANLCETTTSFTISEPELISISSIISDYNGYEVSCNGAQDRSIDISPSDLSAIDLVIPGDISSAAFWMVAAAIHKNAEINIINVGINETRAGIISVLERMGANLNFDNNKEYSGEPVSDITVKTSKLKGTVISGKEIPLLIDEIPIIALAAVFAEGETKIVDAKELRYKESDRISLTVDWMKKAGAKIEELEDGMIINGTNNLDGGTFSSHGDHRLAMTLGIASLVSKNKIEIENPEAANVSYPTFWDTLKGIGK